MILEGHGVCECCKTDLGPDPPFVAKSVEAVRCDRCGEDVAVEPWNMVLRSPEYARELACPACSDK